MDRELLERGTLSSENDVTKAALGDGGGRPLVDGKERGKAVRRDV